MKLSLATERGEINRGYLLLLPIVLLAWSTLAGFGVTAWLGAQGVSEAVVEQWGTLVGKGFWGLIILWLIPVIFTRGFYERFVGPATPGTLGAIRAVTCFVMLTCVLREDLGTTAMLPRSLLDVEKLGVVGWLYERPWGLPALMESVWGCRAFQAVTVLALLLATVGYWTRSTLVMAFGCCVIFGAIVRGYTHLWHLGVVPLYVLGLLCFLPCGHGFSLDRRRRVARGQAVPDADVATALYGWSRYLVWALVAATYVAAGASKLRTGGFWWWWPDNMRRMLLVDALGTMDWDFEFGLWLDRFPDAGWAVMGIAGMWGEVLFGLVLVSVFWRRVMPVVMAGMHVGILLVQNIFFYDMILVQVIFYDWRSVAGKVRRWGGRRVSRSASWWAGSGPAQEADLIAEVSAADVSSVSKAQVGSSVCRRGRFLGPVGLALVLLSSTFVWMQFVETYPFTGMRMYSAYSASRVIHYHTVEAEFADGRSEEIDLGQWVNNMGQGRFRSVIHRAFQGDDRRGQLDAFLAVASARANHGLSADERVLAITVQRHAWRFIDDRASPTYGEIVDRYVYRVDKGTSTVAKPAEDSP